MGEGWVGVDGGRVDVVDVVVVVVVWKGRFKVLDALGK